MTIIEKVFLKQSMKLLRNTLASILLALNVLSNGGVGFLGIQQVSAAQTFATWNPSDKNANVVLSGGNLTATTTSGNYSSVRSTIGVSSGKHYFEYKYTTIVGNDAMPGIALSTMSLADAQYPGLAATSWGVYTPTGNKLHNGTNVAYGTAYAVNDVVMIALDMDNGKVWWGKNGTWFNSGDPAAGTNAAFTSGITGTMYAAVCVNSNMPIVVANFGATAMAYTAPTGFRQGLYTGSADSPFDFASFFGW